MSTEKSLVDSALPRVEVQRGTSGELFGDLSPENSSKKLLQKKTA